MTFRDESYSYPVRQTETAYEGLVWNVRRDTVDLGEAGLVRRDLIEHPGAVAIVALDAEDRVALVHQYRHPIRMRDWEIPAGLLDVDGEAPHLTAARELAEEADLRADDWSVLIDFFTSPGYSDEAIRVFLARGLTDVHEDDRHERTGEELGMPLRWVALDDAFEAVLGGRLHNPHTVIGVLTAHASRARDWRDLRAADSPWPEGR